MDAAQILFVIVAIVTLGAALMVVTARNIMHAALWLIATLFGVAVFYALLNAAFLAVAQVVIYIGAIATLMIFVVMMTRHIVQENIRQVNKGWWLAALVSVVLFAGLAWMLSGWEGFWTQVQPLAPGADPLVALGQALVSPNAFVLPFELASVLLLAALIGAIMIAWEKK
jgi:NADH-quinone oxidoreductase subunit J